MMWWNMAEAKFYYFTDTVVVLPVVWLSSKWVIQIQNEIMH
jgi:hypothetical protein